ncbi:MAG: hypothetical protein GXY05_16520 [Clostridiales bacterium]|nr:hypothetical protein [Clostridiales bacterium]
MDDISRVFPYDRRIMLNVMYDTLDSLGFQIEKANSERGTLIAISPEEPIERVRIACSGVSPYRGDTVVQIFPEHQSDAGKRLAEVLLEEISATTTRCQGYQANKQAIGTSTYSEVQK